MAGPLNGDVYTIVNPNTEKEKNGKVYEFNSELIDLKKRYLSKKKSLVLEFT